MWSTTKAKIQQRIEGMVSRRTGESTLSYVDKLIVSDAINTAMVELCTQTGLGLNHPRLVDITASTTAGTNYVDLSTDVLCIIEGTVRIEAEDSRLASMSLADFYAIDPGEDSQGTPTLYSLGYSGTTPRLFLRDIPDAVYTIALTTKKIVDEDSISSFPGWFHPMIKSLATAQAFGDLNLDPTFHYGQYRKQLQDVKDTLEGDMGPRHIQRAYSRTLYRNIESRR